MKEDDRVGVEVEVKEEDRMELKMEMEEEKDGVEVE